MTTNLFILSIITLYLINILIKLSYKVLYIAFLLLKKAIYIEKEVKYIISIILRS